MQIGLELAGCLLLADLLADSPVRLKSGVPGDGSLSLGGSPGPGDGSCRWVEVRGPATGLCRWGGVRGPRDGLVAGVEHRGRALHTVAGRALSFTAVYAAEPLTEDSHCCHRAGAVVGGPLQSAAGMAAALAFTFAVTFAALLRPDGALVAVALAPALLIGLGARGRASFRAKATVVLSALCGG